MQSLVVVEEAAEGDSARWKLSEGALAQAVDALSHIRQRRIADGQKGLVGGTFGCVLFCVGPLGMLSLTQCL